MKLLCTIIILLVCSNSFALDKNLNSSCKIEVFNGRMKNYGSGTFFDSDDNDYFVITNSHVVIGTPYIYPYKDGKIYKRISSSIRYKNNIRGHNTSDMAILSIKKEDMPFTPEIIPLAPRNTEISVGDKIFGAGFPQSSWCQAWRGIITKSNKYHIFFNMIPLGGQSGSGITKLIDDKEYIIGICTWNTGNGGGGVNLNAIYEMLDNKHIPHNINYVKNTASLDDRCSKCGKTRAEHYIIHNDDSPAREVNGVETFYCKPKLCPRCGKYHLYGDEQPPKERQAEPLQNLPDFLKNYNQDTEPLEDIPNPDDSDAPPPPVDNSELINSLKEKIKILEEKIAELEKYNQSLLAQNEEINNLKQTISSLEEKVSKQAVSNETLLTKIKEKEIKIESLTESLSEIKTEKDELETKVVILESKKSENLSKETQKILETNRTLSVKIEEYKLERIELSKEIENLRHEIILIKEGVKEPPTVKKEEHDSLFSQFKTWLSKKIKTAIMDKFGPIVSAIILSTLGGGFLSGIGFLALRWKFGKKKATIIMRVIATIRKFTKGKNTDESQDTEYNNVEDKPETPKEEPAQSDDCPKINYGIRPNSRFKDLVALQEKEGKKLEHLAALGKLYKEAIHLLRRNQLQSKPGQRFINAYEAASEIENYVKTKMAAEVSEITIGQLTKDDLLREALYGFLYKEAVCKLKRGDFTNVIYNIDIANAIENHVNTRILEYIETGA